eukprot:COSAG01_NODE_17757_length_1126_cov_2.057449_1_plen_51_part_10
MHYKPTMMNYMPLPVWLRIDVYQADLYPLLRAGSLTLLRAVRRRGGTSLFV